MAVSGGGHPYSTGAPEPLVGPSTPSGAEPARAVTRQRVSDEQLAEWSQQLEGRTARVDNGEPMLLLVADLRAAREENQRLQQRIDATVNMINVFIDIRQAPCPEEFGAANRMMIGQLRTVAAALGGGSSD